MSAPGSPFDVRAAQYDQDLNRGISLSGEGKEYFLRGRIEQLRTLLEGERQPPRRILDYGCGAGDAIPLLSASFATDDVSGADVSAALLADARAKLPNGGILDTASIADVPPFDLIYCNGVFHHIPPAERKACLDRIHGALKPGGWLALFENNAINPGTRLVMSRIPFDRDAVPLTHWEAIRRLRQGQFEIRRVTFLFLFPHLLRALRPLEKHLASLPLGAQYLVLARRPA